MKKLISLSIGLIFLVLLALNVNAQEKSAGDYFEGKWKVTFKGTPDGDKKMLFFLSKRDVAMEGTVKDTTGKDLSKITKVELKTNGITLYFTINEHDVSLELTRKDEDHAIGNAMGMFDVEADRVKATN